MHILLIPPHNAGDGEIELRKSCLLRDGASPRRSPKPIAGPIAFQRNGHGGVERMGGHDITTSGELNAWPRSPMHTPFSFGGGG
jgi:hypothetical protein